MSKCKVGDCKNLTPFIFQTNYYIPLDHDRTVQNATFLPRGSISWLVPTVNRSSQRPFLHLMVQCPMGMVTIAWVDTVHDPIPLLQNLPSCVRTNPDSDISLHLHLISSHLITAVHHMKHMERKGKEERKQSSIIADAWLIKHTSRSCAYLF